MSKISYSLSQTSCFSFLSLAQWLPPLCVSHTCVWAAGVLVTLALIPLIPLIPKCWELLLAMYCSTEPRVFYLRLLYCFGGCCSLSLSYLLQLYMWSKSLMFFTSSNAYSCSLCTFTLYISISICSLSISLMFLWAVNSFITSWIISSSFMPLINCSFSHLSCSL